MRGRIAEQNDVITLRCPAELRDQAQQAADQQGIPLAELVRNSLGRELVRWAEFRRQRSEGA